MKDHDYSADIPETISLIYIDDLGNFYDSPYDTSAQTHLNGEGDIEIMFTEWIYQFLNKKLFYLIS